MRILRATLILGVLVALAWLWTVWVASQIKIFPTNVEPPYTDERLHTLLLLQLLSWAGTFSLVVCPVSARWLQWRGVFTPSRLRNVIRVVVLLTTLGLFAYGYMTTPSETITGHGSGRSLQAELGMAWLFTAALAFFFTFPFVWLWLRLALGPSRWVSVSRWRSPR